MAAPVLTAVLITVVVRLGLAVAAHGRSLVPDEVQYVGLASRVASGYAADSWQAGYGQDLYTSSWAFIAPLVQVMKVAGDSFVVARLYVIAVGAALVGLAGRLARETVGRVGLVVVLALLAALPSQVLFGAVVLKEAHVWTCLVLVYLGLLAMAEVRWPRFPAGALLVLVGLVGLGYLRQQTLVAAAWAVPVALLVVGRRQFVPRVAAGVALLVISPWLCGIGPAGWSLIHEGAGALGSVRASLSQNADTGFVDVPEGAAAGRPGAPSKGPGALGIARRNAGRVAEDEDRGVDQGLAADLRAIPGGAAATLLRPFPWERGGSLSFAVARLEDLVWYVLYALAGLGAVTAVRQGTRWRRLAGPVLVALAIVTIAAMTQGNLGTAFRHRGEVLVPVALLAAGGVEEVVRRRTSARAEPG